jgi:hypothetical protein
MPSLIVCIDTVHSAIYQYDIGPNWTGRLNRGDCYCIVLISCNLQFGVLLGISCGR